jgi:hypothetical protein
VDPVPDPLLLTKSSGAGNRTRTFGSVGRNSDHQTIEAVQVNHPRSRKISIFWNKVRPTYFRDNFILNYELFTYEKS